MAKKEPSHSGNDSFYDEIIKQITLYEQRSALSAIIVASPAFFKEDLQKEIKDQTLRRKIILATAHSVGSNGIDEVIKRPEVKTALINERASKELQLVEELLTTIARNGNAAYGFFEVQRAGEAHAISHLLITDSFIMTAREKGTYIKLEAVMMAAEQSRGAITIISSGHDGGQKLEGLGGIGALLRYKLP